MLLVLLPFQLFGEMTRSALVGLVGFGRIGNNMNTTRKAFLSVPSSLYLSTYKIRPYNAKISVNLLPLLRQSNHLLRVPLFTHYSHHHHQLQYRSFCASVSNSNNSSTTKPDATNSGNDKEVDPSDVVMEGGYELLKSAFGEAHPVNGTSLFNLRMCFYLHAYQMLNLFKGTYLHNYGMLKLQQGDYSEAESLLESCIKIRRNLASQEGSRGNLRANQLFILHHLIHTIYSALPLCISR
jgi:hypothetical protein